MTGTRSATARHDPLGRVRDVLAVRVFESHQPPRHRPGSRATAAPINGAAPIGGTPASASPSVPRTSKGLTATDPRRREMCHKPTPLTQS